MASSLPDHPSLDRLRSAARDLQRGARSGDAAALALISEHHPAPEAAATQGFPLHATQLAVARAHGFLGWPALVGYVETAAEFTRNPLQDEARLPTAELFCSLACLFYNGDDEPERWAAASTLLEQEPGLEGISVAATAADLPAVQSILAADPAAATRLAGPHRWAPLLYVTYSRVTGGDPVGVATALLDAGADPDAGFLWSGLATPFTALTGVFGEGEMGSARQPAHPQWQPLARLLLDRGAEPNDAQTLYNRMFRSGTAHLELLFEYGLGAGDGGPWRHRLGAATESVTEMMERQVGWAVDHRMADRLALLQQHGYGPGPTALQGLSAEPYESRSDGATALHLAAWTGDLPLIRNLLAAGADPHALDDAHANTPAGWAEVARQTEAAALLRSVMDGPEPTC